MACRRFHAVANSLLEPAYTISIVPMFADNYAYVLCDSANATCVVVDPAEPAPVIRFLDKGFENETLGELTGVLTTHKHWDHR